MLFGTVGASLWQLALVKINLFVRTLVFTTDLQVLQSSPRDKSPYCSGCQQHLISVLGRLSAFYPPCTSADALCSLCPQTLSHSLRMADQNFEKLKDESDRLEQHAKKSVNWLLWIMLIVVCFIFISMILFIRIFPKLKWFFFNWHKSEGSAGVISVSSNSCCPWCPGGGRPWPPLPPCLCSWWIPWLVSWRAFLGTLLHVSPQLIPLPIEGRTRLKIAVHTELLKKFWADRNGPLFLMWLWQVLQLLKGIAQ